MTAPKFPAAAVLALVAAFSALAASPPERPKKTPDSTVPIIDINMASAEDFAKLPGIGPELARRIVAFREKHGPFRRVEDLLAIRGIGPKKWRGIRPYLRIGESAEKSEIRSQK